MELEFKGTKGSWSIEEKGASILDNTGKSLVCWYGVATSTFWKDEEELKANSKLLASAPDLLEALQHGLRLANILENKESIAVRQFIKAAEQAIEKALK